MGAVAKAAGVAAGTAYVHYESKEELVYAAYFELKAELSAAVLAGYDESAAPYDRWDHLLRSMHEYLAEDPARARFLTQLEESPYYEEAHRRFVESGDPLSEVAGSPDLLELLMPLPADVIYALSLGVAVRLIAAGTILKGDDLDLLVQATWRAVTKPPKQTT